MFAEYWASQISRVRRNDNDLAALREGTSDRAVLSNPIHVMLVNICGKVRLSAVIGEKL